MYSTSLSFHRNRRYTRIVGLLASAFTFAGCSQNPTSAQQTTPIDTSAVSVVVSGEVVGRTPSRIGYVLGEDLPGSNVSSWLRYSEMNAGRFWWAAQVWPAPTRWTGDDSLAKFEFERENFRKNIETDIDWKKYRADVAKAYGGTPQGTIGESFMLSELQKMGATPLLMLTHQRANYPFDKADGSPDWNSRWNFWRGVYTNVFYLTKTYGVERFQLFNEPDHSNSDAFGQSDFIRRLQLGSDAVQAAFVDVNRMYGRNLKPQISAPVTAGMMVFDARSGRKDTRDLEVGWGELAVKTRKDDFPGRGAYNQGTFNVYAFQNYTRKGESISSRLPGLLKRIAAVNGGEPLPSIASELNVSTAFDFSKTPSTLDTPSFYAAFGAIAAAYSNAGLDEGYVFRLTQTNNYDKDGAIKKNGTHFLNNADPLKNILGSTKGGEAARLWMRGFNGGRERFAIPQSSASTIYTLAARDESRGAYTLMVSNLGGPRPVTLDLSAWRLPVGTLVTTEEVSEIHHGDVSGVFELSPTNRVPLSMSGNSIVLVTLRPTLDSNPRIVNVANTGGSWRTEPTDFHGAQVLLSFEATADVSASRIRVYGGAGKIAGAELLGQVVPTGKTSRFTVDASRYVAAGKNSPLIFQFTDDAEKIAAFPISSVQLHVMRPKDQ